MSASWLKIRHDLADDPAVIQLSEAVQIEDDAVIGKLFRLWSWADRHTTDGHAVGIGIRWVDRLTRCEGFGAALVRVGWLVEDNSGLSFPRFDRHCSDTAKARALANERQNRVRHAPVTVPSRSERDKSVTREEEEKSIPPLPREGFDQEAWRALRKAWNAGPGKQWRPINPPPKAVERLADPDWVSMYPEAVVRLRSCRFFDDPVTLNQFCGEAFVLNVLGGTYDERKGRRSGKDFADQPAPPRVFTGEAAEAFERTRRKLASSKEAL